MSTLITDKVDNAAVQKEKLDTSAYLPHTPWLQFLLVCCLFALWGMAGNLNDILIAQFKKGFDLTDTQTALVQSIFFLGYFFVALPAAARKFTHWSWKTFSLPIGEYGKLPSSRPPARSTAKSPWRLSCRMASIT